METKYKIHFSYIISILVVIILILITIKWSSDLNLVGYISFFATIASLLLAVLAIVYAYLSNMTFAKNISMINDVSNDLKNNTQNLKSISETIENDIKSLPQIIAQMDKKVDDLPNRLSEMTAKELVKNEEPNATAVSTNTSSIDQFLASSSFNGLLVLYAIAIAHRKQIPFDRKDFSKNIKSMELGYTWGYLIASASSGVFTFNSSKDIWTITSVQDNLYEKLQKAIKNRGEKVEQELKKNNSDFRWEDRKKNIEDYFEK